MSTFRLPDVGEGLQEAEIVAWHVTEGDHVVADQPLVSIETDKAVVELPSPVSGHIATLLCRPGDVVAVGEPLVEFAEGETTDVGAIVGDLPAVAEPSDDGDEKVAANRPPVASVRAAPAVRALAARLGVHLGGVRGSGPDGTISSADIERAAAAAGVEAVSGVSSVVDVERTAAAEAGGGAASAADVERAAGAESGVEAVRGVPSVVDVERPAAAEAGGGTASAVDVERTAPATEEPGGVLSAVALEQDSATSDAVEPLRGVRRAMDANMTRAHREVVPATVTGVADIGDWAAGTDTTLRLVRAVARACAEEPALNASYLGRERGRRLNSHVDVGIAVDTDHGLFVPVLRDVADRPPEDLRGGLDELRAAVAARSVPPEHLRGATISLSNFGALGGRHAALVVVPPQVAIVGAGRASDAVVAKDGTIVVRRVLPISLTFDHRVVMGGEAARFLTALEHDLELPT